MTADGVLAPPDATSLPARHRARRLVAVGATVVPLLAVLVLRAAVVGPLQVDSSSMAPTLAPGDVVLVSRSAPQLSDLSHGDLVVFDDPARGKETLKRVVGLPGEELVVLDSVLHVDGEPVAEPWVDHPSIDGYYSRTYVVPADHVFVMGDNRGNSVDSRDYGAVAAEDLRGRVIGRLWPVVARDTPPPRPPAP